MSWKSGIFTLLLLLLSTGCFSYKTISQKNDPVIAGEKVQLIIRDGSQLNVVVVRTSPDSIWAENITIARSDIAEVRRKKLSLGRSVVAGVGFFFVTIAVVFTAALLSLASED